ncbi:MAG: hypothetical protein RL607_1137 [Bacteroidota bacterium]|jgi:hypothetical protein
MRNSFFAIVLLLICCNNGHSTKNKPLAPPAKSYAKNHQEARSYCEKNGFATDFYYLIDLSIHPGRFRFFVFDFKKDSITHQNIVTHGSCDVFEENPDQWEKAKFDVRQNSHCSMKGKFKIGKRDYSSWGIKVKYWLHGLEAQNNSAVDRVVVLHSWSAVADKEIYPRVSPLSWGCPAVSDNFMRILDQQLQATKKPVLLWIID